MRKIIGLTIAVVLIIGLVAGGTWAYFTDTETTTGNTFTAGTIDLTISPTDGQAVATATSDLSLKPCQTGFITITLTNDGTNPMDVWKRIIDINCTGGTTTDAELVADPGNTNHAIDTVIIYDMWIEKGGEPLVCEPGSGDVMLVNETEGLHIYDIAVYYMYIGVLAPQETIKIVQSYHMAADTGNWAQGDVMTFTIEFFAQQSEGTPAPPPPGTELTGHGKT